MECTPENCGPMVQVRTQITELDRRMVIMESGRDDQIKTKTLVEEMKEDMKGMSKTLTTINDKLVRVDLNAQQIWSSFWQKAFYGLIGFGSAVATVVASKYIVKFLGG